MELNTIKNKPFAAVLSAMAPKASIAEAACAIGVEQYSIRNVYNSGKHSELFVQGWNGTRTKLKTFVLRSSFEQLKDIIKTRGAKNKKTDAAKEPSAVRSLYKQAARELTLERRTTKDVWFYAKLLHTAGFKEASAHLIKSEG